eukprot:COSAG01_NODE_5052_length_4523_cov_2.790009_4_plen_118_part_00
MSRLFLSRNVEDGNGRAGGEGPMPAWGMSQVNYLSPTAATSPDTGPLSPQQRLAAVALASALKVATAGSSSSSAAHVAASEAHQVGGVGHTSGGGNLLSGQSPGSRAVLERAQLLAR